MVAVGCAAKTSPKAAAEAPQGLVIVRLVGQHQSITVTSGPDGPLYSAQTADGQPIVANATLEELRADHPEIYRFVEPGVAADASVNSGAPRQAKRGTTGGLNHDRVMLDSAR
jgi:hypothetical protein